MTTIGNGSASLILAYNHIASNFFLGDPGYDALDTDDGSDRVNATRNVIYRSGLWKSDFGGHDNKWHGNVLAYVGNCYHMWSFKMRLVVVVVVVVVVDRAPWALPRKERAAAIVSHALASV